MILDAPVGPPGDDGPTRSVTTDTVATGPPDDVSSLVLAQRCAWTLVWVGVLAAGLQYWGAWSAGAWAAVLAPVLVGMALVGTVLLWTVPRPVDRAMQAVGISAALVTVAVTQGTSIHLRHFYTTDSAAFNQAATRLFLDGRNPYTSTMASASPLLHPASAYWTYQVDGVHTAAISYPAGSFLLQAPVMALGLNHMVTDWVDLVAWLVTAVLVFCMLPRVVRWVAPLLLISGVFSGAFANGGTDALFVPFLVLAVWRWDRYPGRAVAWLPSWMGPVSLGVACSIKQSPWFCVPFLVAGVVVEAHRSGGRPLATGLRYGGLTLGSFLAVNVAFIAWSPSAWVRGSFLPLFQPLIADGQGIVALALHGLTGGVVLPWLTAAAGLAFVALLAAFVWWEPRLKRAWLFCVPVVLFLPDRSLANYLLDFVPAALVAAASVRSVPVPTPTHAGGQNPTMARRPWLAPVSVTIPALASMVLVVMAFTSAPLTVTVDHYTSAGEATVDGGLHYVRVTVTVHNTTDRAQQPQFLVSSGGGHPTGFWKAVPIRGVTPVPAGGTTQFALRPSRFVWAPGHGARWLVEAYTTSPNALSTSSMQYWSPGIPGH